MKSRCFEIRKQFNSQMQGLNINATVMASSFLGLVVLLLTGECHAANHQWDMHGEVGVPRDCSTIAFTCNNQRHLTAAWCDECRRRNNLRCLIKFDKSEHGSGIASGCGHHSGGTLFNGGAKKHYKCTLRMNSVRDNEQNRLNTLCTARGGGDHTVSKGTFLRSFMTVEEMRQYQLQRYNLQANELHGDYIDYDNHEDYGEYGEYAEHKVDTEREEELIREMEFLEEKLYDLEAKNEKMEMRRRYHQ